MAQYLTISTLIFFLLNLINVMLSTVKSVLTVKASRLIATLINALAYGYYTIIIKQISNSSIEMVVVVTIVTNLIGVYTSLWLLDKFKKDKVWKISVICYPDLAVILGKQLEIHDIGYNTYEINTKFGQSIEMDIFSKNQNESKIIKGLIGSKYKYNITELSKTL